jgi:hypothetical protein
MTSSAGVRSLGRKQWQRPANADYAPRSNAGGDGELDSGATAGPDLGQLCGYPSLFFFMFARLRQSRDLVVAPRDRSQDAMFQLSIVVIEGGWWCWPYNGSLVCGG